MPLISIVSIVLFTQSSAHLSNKMIISLPPSLSLFLSLSLLHHKRSHHHQSWTGAAHSRTPYLSTRLQQRCQRPETILRHRILTHVSLSPCLRRSLVCYSSQLSARARDVCVSRVMQDANKLVLWTWYVTLCTHSQSRIRLVGWRLEYPPADEDSQASV